MIDPDDMEFKDTKKNVRTKSESSVDSAMLCKVHNLGHGKRVTQTSPILGDQNKHVSWKPTNLRESALERLNIKIMKIALLGWCSIR